MKWLYFLPFLTLWLFGGWRPRCSSTLYLSTHEAQWASKGGKGTKQPHSLEWSCTRCRKIIGETLLTPQWSLMAKLRRQIPWAREQSKERSKVA